MVRRLSVPRRLVNWRPRFTVVRSTVEPQTHRFATPPVTNESLGKPHAAPLRLGRYEVRAKIADGGMATVFVARLARRPSSPRSSLRPVPRSGSPEGPDVPEVVAIKMIRDEFAKNSEFLTMFMDEAKIVSRLRHPNIVRYHELGSEGEHAFIAMELLSGQSLWAVWEACRSRGRRLGYEMIAWMGARVADGLHHAHELVDEDGKRLDIVHRDVNATNIFVTYDGEIKIIDFGLAKAANRASRTAAGIIKGKVAYMSPEQAIGAPIDRRTDVFALGTTLWELSCDRRLFKHADEVETLKRVHAADVPNPTRHTSDFPMALWRALERALARDRNGRYPTAAAFARDLDAFGGGVDAPAVAALMGELFADERARQAAWIAEASAPERPAALPPLHRPSRFWSEKIEPMDLGPSMTIGHTAVTAAKTFDPDRPETPTTTADAPPHAPLTRPAAPKRARALRVVVAIALLLVAVVAAAIALR
jgi:eukaryotic-like serine/threonine-protein kinase